MNKSLILLVTFALFHLSAQDAKKEVPEDDLGAYAEMAASFLKDQNAESIGGLVSGLNNLVGSEGGKQLGDMLMSMGGNKNANQILQSLGSLVGQQASSGGGIDPAIIGSVLSAISSFDSGSEKGNEDSSSNLLSMFSGLLGQEGGVENIMGYLPMLMSTLNSFTGEEAQKRAADHSSHQWFMPPILEKLHIAFDHFMNSELGKSMLKNVGHEKFVKVFSDSDGKFSFPKFVELLENHSFRKHWIHLVTSRIAGMISYFADPKIQKRFLTTIQHVFNGFIRSQGFPKSTMFEPSKPTETISAFINYIFKRYLSYKVNAKQYVKPAVDYTQEVFKLAQDTGYFMGRGIDSDELSHKLADTINLEVIEPVARVYRAYRFAKKNPKCDKYVMCLVNQDQPGDAISLPGLKKMLSRSSSLWASWFLSGHTGTSFWSLYNIIVDEDNCQNRFVDSCNDFHVEEIRVTTEYLHNEL